MKIAVLSAILGNFDTPVDPVEQKLPAGMEMTFHRFTDQDFPPITGLTPRLQYRIPKLFGWEMFPHYDFYLWLDGSMSFTNPESVFYFVQRLLNENADCVFFTHPWRKTVKEEVEHIEQKLEEGNEYITSRYKNGLHQEQLEKLQLDLTYIDNKLYASTVFLYKNNHRMQEAMNLWWFYQSRYYTCDQVSLPYALHLAQARVHTLSENLFKSDYVSLVSKH